MYGWRSKVGLIVPSPNTVAEVEIRSLLPEGVEAYVSRCPYPATNDVDVKEHFYKHDIGPRIIEAAERIISVKPDLIVWACTLGSLLQKPKSNREIEHSIHKKTGFPALTTTTSVIELIRCFELKKIGVITPYPKRFSQAVDRFLTDAIPELQIEVTYDGEMVDGYEKAFFSEYGLYAIAKNMVINAPSIEAIFISCTNWPTREILAYIEADTGRKAFSSITATVWYMLKQLGITEG